MSRCNILHNFTLCFSFLSVLRARHHHNKIAPCHNFKLNWTELHELTETRPTCWPTVSKHIALPSVHRSRRAWFSVASRPHWNRKAHYWTESPGRLMKCCLVSSDVSWHIRDKLWPMPKHGSIFTATETRRLVKDGQPRSESAHPVSVSVASPELTVTD